MPLALIILQSLHSLGAAALVAVAAFGLGRPLQRLVQPHVHGPLAIAVWSTSLGLVAAAMAWLGLAVVGWLDRPLVGLLSIAAALWALVELVGAWTNPARVLARRDVVPPALPFDLRVALLLAGGLALVALAGALVPPTSVEVLARSLEVPKNVLVNQGLGSSTAGLNMAQTWSLWALALDGPVAANLLHWELGLLLALATVLLARPIVGQRAAWMAGCLVVFSPGVQGHLGLPLEQVPLALVSTLSVIAVFDMLAKFDFPRSAIAAGVMLGAAASIGPEGWWISGALAVFLVHAAWSLPDVRPECLRAGLLTAASALVVAVVWAAGAGPAVGFADRGGLLFAGLGPLLVAGLGGLAFARRVLGLRRVLLLLSLLAGGAIVLPATTSWWAIAVPLASVAAAWVWHESTRLPSAVRWGAAAVALVLIVAGMRPGLERARGGLAMLARGQTRHDFLIENVPTYRAASLLNQIGRSEQRLLSQDPRGLYFSCLTSTDHSTSRNQGGADLRSADEQLLSRARAAGYSYLLLAEVVAHAGANAVDGGDRGLAASQAANDNEQADAIDKVIPILEYCFADDNNRTIRYRLLKLHGPRQPIGRQVPLAEMPAEHSASRPPRNPTR